MIVTVKAYRFNKYNPITFNTDDIKIEEGTIQGKKYIRLYVIKDGNKYWLATSKVGSNGSYFENKWLDGSYIIEPGKTIKTGLYKDVNQRKNAFISILQKKYSSENDLDERVPLPKIDDTNKDYYNNSNGVEYDWLDNLVIIILVIFVAYLIGRQGIAIERIVVKE